MCHQNPYPIAECLVKVCGQTFRAAYRTVMSSCTAEIHGEAGKPAAEIFVYGCIDQSIDILQIDLYFSLSVQKFYHLAVASGQSLVFIVQTRVMHTAAVKYESTAVAAAVLGNTLAV